MKMYFNQSVIWSIGWDLPADKKLVGKSVDEKYFVIAGSKSTVTEIVILNSTTGETLSIIGMEDFSASCLAFSPDNVYVFIGG